MISDFDRKNQYVRRDRIFTGLLRTSPYLLVFLFTVLLGRIVLEGAPVLSSEGFHFLTHQSGEVYSFYDENEIYHQLTEEEFVDYQEAHPDDLYLSVQKTENAGGILGALVGTILLVLMAMFLALMIGFPTALFLCEYRGRGRFIPLIRMANRTLAGVPPVIFGLFGLAFFCYFFPVISKSEPTNPSTFRWVLPNCPDWLDGGGSLYFSFQGWGLSLIAMGCTLACMALPIVISGCEESFRKVPQRFRDAALALGASRWSTIRHTVLQTALPGVLLTVIGGVFRIAGAAAPILFTGAIAAGSIPLAESQDKNLFWKTVDFLGRECQALPSYIYVISTQTPQNDAIRQMRDGAVFVLMLIVLTPVALSLLLQKKSAKTG